MAYHLEKRWIRLFNSAYHRENTLRPIKQKFAEMTANEISVFYLDVRDLIYF